MPLMIETREAVDLDRISVPMEEVWNAADDCERRGDEAACPALTPLRIRAADLNASDSFMGAEGLSYSNALAAHEAVHRRQLAEAWLRSIVCQPDC